MKNNPTTDWNLLIYIAVIILATIVLVILSNRMFNRLIRKELTEKDGDPTSYTFLKHAITAIFGITGFSFVTYMIPDLRHIAQSLLATAGIVAVVVGFASQQALSNIIGGVFVVILNPIASTTASRSEIPIPALLKISICDIPLSVILRTTG